jgi:proline iminopeptidase
MSRRISLLAAAALMAACTSTVRPPGAVPLGAASGAHQVVLNGVRHWYRVAGQPVAAPVPVVFLHGGPGQGSVHFAELVGPLLEPSLRMVYFDQRASGRSDPSPDGIYTLPMLVEDLEALRRTLGAPKLALIGQSFGGTLALEYAAAYPEHVSAVVFVAGLWDIALQCRLRNRTLAERAPEAYERVRAEAEGSGRDECLEFQAFPSEAAYTAYGSAIMFPDSAVRLRMEAIERAHGYHNTRALGGGLFRSGLATYGFTAADRVAMPVLVIAGRHDGTARPEGLRALADRLPAARFAEYEASGHFVYLDEPERFAREVVQFLREAAR